MQQATLAQSVEQRIRNAQVNSSSLLSGSKSAILAQSKKPIELESSMGFAVYSGFIVRICDWSCK